jgi:glycosyltransferase involved in cell wall biosynthesis/SAM-dependent methyltransferase
MDVRVLLVTPYPPARDGIASYAAQVAAELRRQGNRVEVVSPEPSAAQRHLNYRRFRGPLRLLRLSRRAERTLVEFYPELFFYSRRLRFLLHWPFMAAFLAFGRDVELVVHEAPYRALRQAPGLPGGVARALWRALLTLPDRTFVHTEWERREMAGSVGLEPERIKLLEHHSSFTRRTRLSRAEARRELGLREDEFCFLCIGFLQYHKGFDRAVRALSRLPGARLRLDIVGSGRLVSPEIEYFVAELRALVAATPRARLHEGYVSDHAFDCWLQACDVVVLPYRDIWSSGVLARARLFERPLIASEVGGLPDQLGSLGTVVRDDEELCRAMAEAAEVPCLPAVPAGEGSAEHDELLSYEEAVELVRKRASAERGHSDLEVSAPISARDRLPHFTLPDPNLGGAARASLKRTIARLTRWQLAPLVRQLNEARGYLQERFAQEDASREVQASQLARLHAMEERAADEETRTAELAGSLQSLKQAFALQLDELRTQLDRLDHLRADDRAELTSALARMRAGGGPPPQPSPQGAGSSEGGGSPDLEAFYEAHQDRFRGSRESVRQRLEIYLPHVRTAADSDHPALDVGPGRGEWLALLAEHHIKAYGVDINSAFVTAAGEIGLDVRHADGVEHLKGVPDGSLGAVTAFHVVEHIPLDALIELVDNALRALRPGGVLILETPNPLNIEVGASQFHLDPTHIRPIHPLFLQFVLENRGFADVRAVMVNAPGEPPLEVQLPPDGKAGPVPRMAELLNKSFFVGMDYAVIGRRADPEREAVKPEAAPEPAPEAAPEAPETPPKAKSARPARAK